MITYWNSNNFEVRSWCIIINIISPFANNKKEMVAYQSLEDQTISRIGGNKMRRERYKHEYFVLCINFFTMRVEPMLRDVLPHQYVYYPINRCSCYNKHANNHVSSEEIMHLNGTCQWISVIPVTQTFLKRVTSKNICFNIFIWKFEGVSFSFW